MIAIIDYGMGNVGSVLNMLRKVGASAVLTSDAQQIAVADKLILPGVGAFGAGMANLRERQLLPVLEQRVLGDGVPILGICLGFQLFTKSSEEGGPSGLGWLDGRTKRFAFAPDSQLKVPHMGWNTIAFDPGEALFEGLPADSRFYFVHAFHVTCERRADVVATCSYGGEFVAAAKTGNVYGVQFHPEKSHRFGLRLMTNFAAMRSPRSLTPAPMCGETA